jgi:hypothetical protein
MKRRSMFVAALMGGAILLGLSSCATVSNEPLAAGEMRLLSVAIPSGEVVRAGLGYEAKVVFKADGQPKIRRVCFSWSGDGPYCYAVNPKDVEFGFPGSFRVPLTPTFTGTFRLECFAEYFEEKRILRTNSVSTQVFVH